MTEYTFRGATCYGDAIELRATLLLAGASCSAVTLFGPWHVGGEDESWDLAGSPVEATRQHRVLVTVPRPQWIAPTLSSQASFHVTEWPSANPRLVTC